MSETQSNLAEQWNRNCDCSGADLQSLRQSLDGELGRDRGISIAETHPHLFTDTPVFLDASHARQMVEVVAAIESVVRLPAYQERVLAEAPAIARHGVVSAGVFSGFDFHMAPDGPRLIEINTNAGGGFLQARAQESRQSCCPQVADPPPAPGPGGFGADIVAMFRNEWRLARGSRDLNTIAIVDDAPREQYLYPEFLLARSLFEENGHRALIVEAADIRREGRRIFAGDTPLDLVYNRLTDFQLEEARHAVLREAYLEDLAVITPNPRAHALYASKCNLARLSDPLFLASIEVPVPVAKLLRRVIPPTHRVVGGGERWWEERRQWFFKPRTGYGSRGVYRGEKLTRRVHEEIVRGDYMAQRYTPPAERWRNIAGARHAFKYDIRCYAYGGNVQHIVARLYQGQATNFRTPGGGFAPVFLYGETIPGGPRN